MKHHVVFCYQEHGAVMASTTVETEAYDPLPGSEAWLEMVKKKCADEVNYDVVVASWQALLETATEGDFPGNYGPEVVQRAEVGDAALARGLAARNERIAAIEAAKHLCDNCEWIPTSCFAGASGMCNRSGMLVTADTHTTCRHFVAKGVFAPAHRCGDCLYLQPSGCNLLNRAVDVNTIGRCGKFSAKVTP